ncbi:MAG: CopD family protein [Gammaproteobacteria bacterium]|nr:CopD family protein [Gammaproteobacteria bacterium]
MVYLWTKSLHLLFVIAWMAAVFYLPRILVNLAEAGDVAPVRERLQLMGKRLYGFGHLMFAIAFVLGLLLWLGPKGWPSTFPDMVGGRPWMHAKLGLVALLLAYFIVCGRMLKRSMAGGALPSSGKLRWFNELPVFALLAIIYLVLAKPF